jgi:hypothetical protein
MDNVRKHDTCINVPSSQTFRSYLVSRRTARHGITYKSTLSPEYGRVLSSIWTMRFSVLCCTISKYFQVRDFRTWLDLSLSETAVPDNWYCWTQCTPAFGWRCLSPSSHRTGSQVRQIEPCFLAQTKRMAILFIP